MRPSDKELLRVAQSHLLAAYGETLEASVAVACYARNLIEHARLPLEIATNELLELAPALSEARYEALDKNLRRGFKASLRIVEDVWDDKHIDLTAGAVRAHRHNHAPRWAELSWPTALIGPWIFYKGG